MISVLRPSYAYGEKYMTYLKGGSETVSQDAQKLADEQNALNNEINDYQNNHNTGGVKQAELPVELEEKIIDFSQKKKPGEGVGVFFFFFWVGEISSLKKFFIAFQGVEVVTQKIKGGVMRRVFFLILTPTHLSDQTPEKPTKKVGRNY